jgi:hypothetical protein
VEGVARIETRGPFRLDDKKQVSDLGEEVREEYLLHYFTDILTEPFLSSPYFHGLSALDAADSYFRRWINLIFKTVYEITHLKYEHTRDDDEFVWSVVHETGSYQRRFAVLSIVDPGSIKLQDFDRITAIADEEEEILAKNFQQVALGLSVTGRRQVRRIFELYNIMVVVISPFVTLKI